MSREAHVRFYESLGVGLPGATHPSTGQLVRLGGVGSFIENSGLRTRSVQTAASEWVSEFGH